MAGNTEFITVKDEEVTAEWPGSSRTIVTAVIGDLADRIRARTGATGSVQITEYGQEGGYSEYTVEWDWDFEVKVGGTVVYRAGPEWDNADFHQPQPYNSFGRFMHWLEEEK